MSVVSRYLVNGLWNCACAPVYRAMVGALRRPGETQERYLRELLCRNAKTDFGNQHGFAKITSVEDYQRSVPISEYEDYADAIDRIAAGARGVLTRDPVTLFEPTSGTSAGTKYIPYTAGLRREFQAGIGAWMHRMYRDYPRLLRGKAYWSISPPLASTQAFKGVIPVGFDDDASYLGPWGRMLYRQVQAVDGSVAELEGEAFRIATAEALLRCDALVMMSVWSPTFLLVLIDVMREHGDELLGRMEGTVSKARLGRIEAAVAGREPMGTAWEHLTLLSMWADGASARPAEKVAEEFSGVAIEGKGLISTEAFVSFPWSRECDPVLSVRSHFFEFRDVQTGEVRLAEEVAYDREYEVIVTTGGGLYRYRTHDVVRITGHVEGAPTLRFVGRDGAVVDRCGEKLSEAHVIKAIDAVVADRATFAMVAPVELGAGKHAYGLFADLPRLHGGELLAMGKMLEDALGENYHYANARKMGQLDPARVFLIDASQRSPERAHADRMRELGVKEGDVKPSRLSSHAGWERVFPGRFV
jgi:hypothetical protein